MQVVRKVNVNLSSGDSSDNGREDVYARAEHYAREAEVNADVDADERVLDDESAAEVAARSGEVRVSHATPEQLAEAFDGPDAGGTVSHELAGRTVEAIKGGEVFGPGGFTERNVYMKDGRIVDSFPDVRGPP